MDPLALAPAAFLAGVLMFLAPCTLPIVPGYLAFIGGVRQEDAGARRARIVGNALMFIIGFSLVFVALGAFAGAFGEALGIWRYALGRFAGAMLIVFGLTMLGMRVPFLSAQASVRLPSWLTLGKPQSSFLIGTLFALGWSPCIGPILGTILLLASSSATAASGAALLTLFSLGLGLPFLLIAFFIARADALVSRFSRVSRALELAAGSILIALGLLMLFNSTGLLVGWGYQLFGFMHYDALLNYL